MTAYAPKPQKPATDLNSFVAGIPVTGYEYNRDGNLLYKYTEDGTATQLGCHREYHSGYPGKKIGPSTLFRYPADYWIQSGVWSADYGEEVFVFDDGNFARRYTGGSSRNRITVGNTSKYWTGLSMNAIPTNIYNRLSTEVMLKVGSKKASIGQAIAESKEAIHLLFHSAITLFTAFKAAKKGNFRKVMKTLGVSFRSLRSKSIAGKWLELQFGWLPLMQDIHDTAQLIQKGFREKTHLASNIRVLKDTQGDSPYIDGNYEFHTEGSARYTMKVFYEIDPSVLRQLGEAGLINPVEIAWELVPFSFVVDWFLPVGNFLDALAAPLGVQFIAGYYSIYTEATFRELSPTNAPAYSHLLSNTRWQKCELMGFRRYTLAGFPRAALYWKDPFSANHLADTLALVRQRTR